MSSLRLGRSALRLRSAYVRPRFQSRSYADVASDKIKLSLTLPHQVRRCYSNLLVQTSVNSTCRPFSKAPTCMLLLPISPCVDRRRLTELSCNSVQVNIAAETGDMGVLANHMPSIEQLKPGLIEVIEESGGNKQFFRTSPNEWSLEVG
jgi:F-type H+-transporting ATPase subunit delta